MACSGTALLFLLYTWGARVTKSLIDYVIVNKRLKHLVRDTTVYRGSDIYADHCLLVSKICIINRWRKFNRKKEIDSKNEVYKVYLLQDDSFRRLYQGRLMNYTLQKPISMNIDEEWKNLVQIMEKAANEALGKKTEISEKTRIKNME
jgi:hypothetical protein